MSRVKRPLTLQISISAICAALYAWGSYWTAYIVSPWGRGQFRPAVVIPQVFAIVFGGLPAGIGAAIGTFLVDSIKHGYPYIPSLIAAVPSNFMAFYIYGRMLEEKFSWNRFIIATYISLLIGNLFCAFLYVPTVYFLGALPASLNWIDLSAFAIALTIWWFVTMLPFSLILTPILVKTLSYAFPSIVPSEVRLHSLSREPSLKSLSTTIVFSGLILVILGSTLMFTPLGDTLFYGFTVKLKPTFALLTIQLINFILLGCGFIMTSLGILINIIKIGK